MILGIDEVTAPGHEADHHKYLVRNRATVGSQFDSEEVRVWIEEILVNTRTAFLGIEMHKEEFPDLQVPDSLVAGIAGLEQAKTFLEPQLGVDGQLRAPALPFVAFTLAGQELDGNLSGFVTEFPEETDD
jgi:hypothetical protein